MSHHERIVCERCSDVITQCRCIEPKTDVKRGLCEKCQRAGQEVPITEYLEKFPEYREMKERIKALEAEVELLRTSKKWPKCSETTLYGKSLKHYLDLEAYNASLREEAKKRAEAIGKAREALEYFSSHGLTEESRVIVKEALASLSEEEGG